MNRYKYGILDEDNKVVRWVLNKPTNDYQYITVKIEKPKKLDLSQFEDAPY